MAAELTHFAKGYWSVPAGERYWCDECLQTSVLTVERRMAVIDEHGATSMRIGAGLYCFDHEDFVSPVVKS